MNNPFIPVRENSIELTRELFIQNENNYPLLLKLTNEEEKYVYLINKLKLSSNFVSFC